MKYSTAGRVKDAKGSSSPNEWLSFKFCSTTLSLSQVLCIAQFARFIINFALL